MKLTAYLFLAIALILLISSFLFRLETIDGQFYDTYFIFDQAFLIRLASFILALVAILLLAIRKISQRKTNK